MRRLAILFLLSAITVLALRPGYVLRAQSPGLLPSDLFFSTDPNANDFHWEGSNYNLLAYVDSSSLEVVPFYQDTEAVFVRAVSWSPDGSLLAILRMLPVANVRELCLLSRHGEFLRCFEERPTRYRLEDENYVVKWSADSQKVYFVSEVMPDESGGTRRLIEADVATGETIRVIYEYPFGPGQLPSHLTWSPDFNYVIVGADQIVWTRESANAPTLLVNMNTGEQRDLTSIVPAHTSLLYVCPQMSPMGTYLTARAFYKLEEFDPTNEINYDDGLELTILYNYQTDTQIILGVPEDDQIIMPLGCPEWQPDEQAFFFLTRNALDDTKYLYKYSLTDQALSLLHEAPREEWGPAAISTPLLLSPDGNYLAYRTSYEWPLVGVLYPDGSVHNFGSPPYEFALFPLWGPSEEAD